MKKADARYIKIADQIGAQIRDLQPLTLLPTEHQFASRYRVSRVTIRRALGLLERSGRITRQAGRGTIVSPPKLVRHLVPSCSIDEDFKDQGACLETLVLGFERKTSAPEEAYGYLNLGRNRTVGRLELLRIVEDHIICHDVRYFPPRIADRLNIEFIKTRPISEVVQDIAGQEIVLSDIITDIAPAPAEVAKKLKVTPGMLVATHTFVEYLQDQVPVQLGVMSYRVDRVQFKIVQAGAPFTHRRALAANAGNEAVTNTDASAPDDVPLGKPRRRS